MSGHLTTILGTGAVALGSSFFSAYLASWFTARRNKREMLGTKLENLAALIGDAHQVIFECSVRVMEGELFKETQYVPILSAELFPVMSRIHVLVSLYFPELDAPRGIVFNCTLALYKLELDTRGAFEHYRDHKRIDAGTLGLKEPLPDLIKAFKQTEAYQNHAFAWAKANRTAIDGLEAFDDQTREYGCSLRLDLKSSRRVSLRQLDKSS